MTPKQKAKELVNKYWDIEDIDFLKSKECAFILVDEVLNQFTWLDSKGSNFWKEVKNEIEIL